jgi:hypothetical protein
VEGPAKPIADQDPSLTAQARAAMADLAGGKPPSRLHPELGAKLTPAVLKRVEEALLEAGTLRSVALLSSQDADAVRKLRYRFSYENETLLVSLQVDKESQLKAINFSPE